MIVCSLIFFSIIYLLFSSSNNHVFFYWILLLIWITFNLTLQFILQYRILQSYILIMIFFFRIRCLFPISFNSEDFEILINSLIYNFESAKIIEKLLSKLLRSVGVVCNFYKKWSKLKYNYLPSKIPMYIKNIDKMSIFIFM